MAIKPYFLIASFSLGFSSIFLSILCFGWGTTWRALKIPSMSPPFADMRTVQWAPKTKNLGGDPQATVFDDSLRRAMNYPMVWERFSRFANLENEKNFLVFELVSVLSFLTCCFFLLLRTSSWWVLACLFSGACLLAIERGNNDLVVFSFLFFAGFIRNSALFSGVILFLFNLKIYPLFAGAPIFRWKRFIFPMGLSVVLNLVFLWKEIWKIKAVTPLSTGLSYGASSFTWYLSDLMGIGINPLIVRAALICLGLIFVGLPWIRDRLQVGCESEHTKTWFLMSGGIFLCTFLLGSNFDYRLIFMLLSIPYFLCIKNFIFRTGALLALSLSVNYLALESWMGPYGVFINFLAKSALFALVQALFIREAFALPCFEVVNNSVKNVVKRLSVRC